MQHILPCLTATASSVELVEVCCITMSDASDVRYDLISRLSSMTGNY